MTRVFLFILITFIFFKLLEYEIQSAKNIAIKKQNSLEREEIIAYLAKKGYLSETIKIALEE